MSTSDEEKDQSSSRERELGGAEAMTLYLAAIHDNFGRLNALLPNLVTEFAQLTTAVARLQQTQSPKPDDPEGKKE